MPLTLLCAPFDAAGCALAQLKLATLCKSHPNSLQHTRTELHAYMKLAVLYLQMQLATRLMDSRDHSEKQIKLSEVCTVLVECLDHLYSYRKHYPSCYATSQLYSSLMLLLQDCFDDVRKKLDAAGCRSLKVPDIQLAKEKMGLCRRLHSLAQYWKGRDKTTADAVLMPMKKILYGRDTRDFTYEVLEYIQHIFPVLEQAIRQAKSDDEIVQLLLDHNFNHPEILFLHEQQLDAELADMSNNKKIAHLERQLKMVKSGLFTYKGALLPGGKSARKMKKKRYKKLKDYYSHLEQVAWDAASATAGMPSFEPLVWNMSTREFAAFCKMWKECEVFKNKDFIAILRTLLLVSRFSDTKEPPKADHVNNLAKQLSFPTHTKLSRLVQDSKSYLNSRSMRAKKE